MLSPPIIETLKPLVARLNPAQRLELIRWIATDVPPETSDETLVDTSHESRSSSAWAARISEEAAAWYARPAADRVPYTGQYVAVLEGQVIDHDPDQRDLAIRIHRQYPHTPVLITEADARAPREYHILSPHWVTGSSPDGQ